MEQGDQNNSVKMRMENADALAPLQSPKIETWKSNNDFIRSLPLSVRKRVIALKKLHLNYSLEEAKYHKDAHELECEYYKKYQDYFNKRKNLIEGLVEPTEDEVNWLSDDDTEITEKMENTTIDTKTNKALNDENVDTKGIPDFWLTAMKNTEVVSELIEEHDVPILKHLKDIKIIMHKEPIGYTLEFYFEPNEFFTNSVLTKYYEFSCKVAENEPLPFEGPESTKCQGCTINWKPGKNVTVRLIKKRQKHKTGGQMRLVNKTVKTDSFFNFFETLEIPENVNSDEMHEDLGELIAEDVEIGNFIRERLVPRAIFYYTGFYTPDEAEEESDDEEEEDLSDEPEDEEDE